MYLTLQKLLQERLELLRKARFEELAHFYACPFVAFRGDKIVLLRERSDVEAAFARLRASQIARGVKHFEAEIVAAEIPRKGRLRIWNRYVETDREGRVLSCNDVLQYCIKTDTGFLIEMTEADTCSMCAPVQSTTREKSVINSL